MTDGKDDLENLLTRLFGDPISTYTDEQAVRDGVLIPFILGGRDTSHRVTRCAFLELEGYYRDHGYSKYDHEQFYRFFYAELVPLIGAARNVYQNGGILTTDFDFRVVRKGEEVLWYIPNELGGLTMMLPSDY